MFGDSAWGEGQEYLRVEKKQREGTSTRRGAVGGWEGNSVVTASLFDVIRFHLSGSFLCLFLLVYAGSPSEVVLLRRSWCGVRVRSWYPPRCHHLTETI
jgi:hypothetical protein